MARPDALRILLRTIYNEFMLRFVQALANTATLDVGIYESLFHVFVIIIIPPPAMWRRRLAPDDAG
jgi:hypothetical protein